MPTAHNDTEVFPLLADPANYVACQWDLGRDAPRRDYWLGVFRGHFPTMMAEARREAEQRGVNQDATLAEAKRQFDAYLDALTRHPDAFGRLDVIAMCWKREELLLELGIPDPYRLVKARENAQALKLMPALLAELDALEGPARIARLIEGVFAGNIFDMGALETLGMFEQGTVDFDQVRAKLKPRPWRYDALEDWQDFMHHCEPHRAALLFVDNAGPDIVLGMIPFARDLARRGTDVVLAANSEPSLNDVTHTELADLLDQIAGFDPVIKEQVAAGRLRVVESGNWAPLIDLSRVSPDLAAVCNETRFSLVVLEGMGRSIESNFEVELKADTLWLAMLKDTGVAEALDAEVFDLVMRYRGMALDG
ncbi:MAG: ARMT1-like domain-containing protein [Planctomycetota bacterium]